jgi:hypothetical protein
MWFHVAYRVYHIRPLRAIRFDLSFALLAYGLMRIQATATENEIYFEVDGFQTAMDLYFFLAFLGVSRVPRHGLSKTRIFGDVRSSCVGACVGW